MIPPDVAADDRGLLLGDGLFETILAEDGRMDRFDAHLRRMVRGCTLLGLPPPDAGAAEASAREALLGAGLGAGRAAVRLSWTAGSGRGLDRPQGPPPRLLVAAFSAPPPQGPARLVTVGVRRNEGSPASRLKTLSYLDHVLARLEARGRGADEALMLNNAGEVAGGAAANLFWIEHGRLYTPALECGVLDGIVRAAVLAAAGELGVERRELRAGPEALARADALFLTSSLIGVRPAAELDGRALAPHRLVAALSSRCR